MTNITGTNVPALEAQQSLSQVDDSAVLLTNDSSSFAQQQSTATGQITMSKNQMKRLARQQRLLELRPLKRKREKEKQKARKKETIAKMVANGESILQFKMMSESSNRFRIVIDLDFEDSMTDYELSLAAKQVNRIYSLNRRSQSPCQLYVSSLKGERLKATFIKVNCGYMNWDVNVSEKDYMELFLNETDGQNVDKLKEQLIYLTGDTDIPLPTVNELLNDDSKIFIIGGLVDHNRHKNLCYRLASERQIKTARLPLKENNIQLAHRHIFSTITVFEIMLNVLSNKMQWPEALLSAIPKRKLAPSVSKEKSKSEYNDRGPQISAKPEPSQ